MKPTNMTVTIRIQNMVAIQNLMNLWAVFMDDERISQEVREEYARDMIEDLESIAND